MQVQMIAAPVLKAAVPANAASRSPVRPPVLPTQRRTFHSSTYLRQVVAKQAVATLPGPFEIVANIVRESGPRGLWLGTTGTVVRETGGTAMWFVLKEVIASALIGRRLGQNASDQSLTSWESALSGAVAGGACVALLYPADTVKSVVQTVDEMYPGQRRSMAPTFVGTAKAMYRSKGWAGLYAGCGMTVLRAIPSSGIVFVVYDGLSQRFGP